jgi:hypothetical protein
VDVKLIRLTVKPAMYQTEPIHGAEWGRFQVYRTDNTSARNLIRLPKWTVRDLYKPLSLFPVRLDTLQEVKEYIARVLEREGKANAKADAAQG